MDPKDKTKLHDITKRIKYQSRLPGARYIDPGTEQVTFEHLSDTDYLLLRRKRIIKPAAAAVSKQTAKKEN